MNTHRILKCVNSRKNFRDSLLHNIQGLLAHLVCSYIPYTWTEILVEPLFTQTHKAPCFLCSFKSLSFLGTLPDMSRTLQRHVLVCSLTLTHTRQCLQVSMYLRGCSICMWLFSSRFPEAGPPDSAGEQGARVHFRPSASLFLTRPPTFRLRGNRPLA